MLLLLMLPCQHATHLTDTSHTHSFKNLQTSCSPLFRTQNSDFTLKRSWQNNTSRHQSARRKVYFRHVFPFSLQPPSVQPHLHDPHRFRSLRTDRVKKTERFNPSSCPPEAPCHKQYITGEVAVGACRRPAHFKAITTTKQNGTAQLICDNSHCHTTFSASRHFALVLRRHLGDAFVWHPLTWNE